MGPAEDAARRRRAARARGDRERLAAVGHPHRGDRRALQRRLQLCRRRGRQCARRHERRRQRQPEPDRVTELRAEDPDHGRSRLRLLGQPVRAVQHRGLHRAVGLGIEPEPRPGVGTELHARLFRQDRGPRARAQLPAGRQPQHPVPDRGVQRVQYRHLQRPQHHVAGDEPGEPDRRATPSTTHRATWSRRA